MSIKWIAVTVCLCVSALGQSGYSGPQILSRLVNTTGERGGAATGFQFYAGVNGTYETGYLPAAIDAAGHIVKPGGLYGVFADIGAYGRHKWRHTTLGLDYSGNFRHYTTNSSFDGSDHMLGLAITTQLSNRLQVFSRTSAGTFSRYYVSGPAVATDLLSSPGYGVFDNRAFFLEESAGASYQVSSRLSFSAVGSGFAVRRQSKALVGLNGYSGQGSAAYQLGKTKSVNVSYAFTHFDYPRGFGESNLHTYMVGYSQALGKRWGFSVSAGAARVSTVGAEQVAADPITAALFGNTTVIQAFSRSIYVASGQGSLTGTFKRSRVEAHYTQMPSAGNGVYLTSKQSTGGATYSYTGIRKASLSIGGNYMRLSSLGQSQLGQYSYATGTVSGSYKLLPALEANAMFDARNVQFDQLSGLSRLSYRVSIGLNWHPGEIPISFW